MKLTTKSNDKSIKRNSVNFKTLDDYQESGNSYDEDPIEVEFTRGNVTYEKTSAKEKIYQANATLNRKSNEKDFDLRDIGLTPPPPEEKNFLYYIRKNKKPIWIIIALLIAFSIRFDGFKEFKKSDKDKYTLTDARKLFFQGKYFDSKNCYYSIYDKLEANTRDWAFFIAAEKMINLNWPNQKKRIFFRLPRFSFFSDSGDGTNKDDELPNWIKSELYDTAENYFNNKTDKFYINEFDVKSLYNLCGKYKNSITRSRKYSDAIVNQINRDLR